MTAGRISIALRVQARFGAPVAPASDDTGERDRELSGPRLKRPRKSASS